MVYKRVKEGCHVDKHCEVAEMHSRWDEARAKTWCFILTALWFFRLKKDRCCDPLVHKEPKPKKPVENKIGVNRAPRVDKG